MSPEPAGGQLADHWPAETGEGAVRPASARVLALAPTQPGSPRPAAGQVDRPDLAALRDLCGARQALETYAAGLAAERRTGAHLARLGRSCLAVRRLLARARGPVIAGALLDEFLREEVRFHLAVVAAAANVWLSDEFTHLRVVQRVVTGATSRGFVCHLAAGEQSRSEHEEILAAITARAPAAAKAAMARHLGPLVGNLAS